jgi:hypothetical protein
MGRIKRMFASFCDVEMMFCMLYAWGLGLSPRCNILPMELVD